MATRRFSLALALLLILTGCTSSVSQEEQLKATTLQIQQTVQTELDNLDDDVSAAASQLSGTGLSGPEAKQILNGLCGKYPYIIDFATADTAGNMVTVAPDAYSNYEGTYIATENMTAPALSPMMRAVEGMDSVSLLRPIFSDKGDYMGTLSALFIPETFLAIGAAPALKGTGIVLNVMQLDGLNIYDSEGVDAGKNLLIDPAFQPYKELVELGNRMVAQESGSGSYTYISHATGKPVKKLAFWASVGLHDTAWRLVSEHEVAE
jgi:hypothetical protein